MILFFNHFGFSCEFTKSTMVLITQVAGPFANEHSASIRNSKDFKARPDWSRAGQFRSTPGGKIYNRIDVPATAKIVWGQLKTQKINAAFPLSLRFPVNSWTADQAREWMKNNKVNYINFKPAEPKEESNSRPPMAGPPADPKTWYKIENAKKAEADVYIFDEIGMWGIDAQSFANAFSTIEAPVINVHINSPGGSIFDGHAIYNTINGAKDKIVNIFIEGLAASMAAVIAMAGDTVNMAENALIMIHNPVARAHGEKKDLERVAGVLEKLKGTISNIFVKKTGLPAETINKWMDAETWFNAGEALENKFIDKITDLVDAANVFAMEKYNYKNIAVYNSVKHKLKPKTQEVKMNLEELKSKYPEVYEAALNEGKVLGVAEGKQAGIEEGTTAGAKAERERIEGIEGIKAEGHEKVIADNKFKPEATKDSVSALVLAAQDKKKTDAATAAAADGTATAAAAGALGNNAPTNETEAEDNAAAELMAAGGNDAMGTTDLAKKSK